MNDQAGESSLRGALVSPNMEGMSDDTTREANAQPAEIAAEVSAEQEQPVSEQPPDQPEAGLSAVPEALPRSDDSNLTLENLMGEDFKDLPPDDQPSVNIVDMEALKKALETSVQIWNAAALQDFEDAKDDPFLAAAIDAFVQGEYAKATPLFKRKCIQDSDNWLARLYLSRCFCKSGDFLAAERSIFYIVENCPDEQIKERATNELTKFRSIQRDVTLPAENRTPTDPLPAVTTRRRTTGRHASAVQITLPALNLKSGAVVAIVLLGCLYGLGLLFLQSSFFVDLILKPAVHLETGRGMPSLPPGTKIEEVTFPGLAGNKLSGILYRQPSSDRLIIVNHGFDGDISDRRQLVEGLLNTGFSVFIYDYQGYGRSSGKPDLTHIAEDGYFAFDYAHSGLGYQMQDVIVYGEALGSGVATQVAHWRPCAGLVMDGSFTNLPDLVKMQNPILKIYPDNFFPPPRMDNLSYLQQSPHVPILFVNIVENADIPVTHSQICSNKATEPKRVLDLTDYSKRRSPGFKDAVSTFFIQ